MKIGIIQSVNRRFATQKAIGNQREHCLLLCTTKGSNRWKGILFFLRTEEIVSFAAREKHTQRRDLHLPACVVRILQQLFMISELPPTLFYFAFSRNRFRPHLQTTNNKQNKQQASNKNTSTHYTTTIHSLMKIMVQRRVENGEDVQHLKDIEKIVHGVKETTIRDDEDLKTSSEHDSTATMETENSLISATIHNTRQLKFSDAAPEVIAYLPLPHELEPAQRDALWWSFSDYEVFAQTAKSISKEVRKHHTLTGGIDEAYRRAGVVSSELQDEDDVFEAMKRLSLDSVSTVSPYTEVGRTFQDWRGTFLIQDCSILSFYYALDCVQLNFDTSLSFLFHPN